MKAKAANKSRQNADEFLTTREAAAYLKASDRWLRDQPIPVVRLGRFVRYRKVDLDDFMASHLTGTGGRK